MAATRASVLAAAGASADDPASPGHRERLELALQAARIGVWDWDLTGDSLVLSSIAKEICGFPTNRPVTYEDVVAVTHPEDRPLTHAQMTRALDAHVRDATACEHRVVRPGGEVRWVLTHGHAVFKDDGGGPRAVRYVGTLQDITERRRMEADVADRQAILQSLLDAAALYVGMVELRDDGFDFLMTNKATADFYGIAPGSARIDAREVTGGPQQIARARAFLQEVWDKGEPMTAEHPFSHNGKRVAWCLGTYTPLPASPEGRPRLSFVLIDITGRKMADERQHLLMREVDHRAKNALAVAQAVVELTRESDPVAFKRAVVGRVSAIARTHSLLADGRWTGVDLRRMVAEELAPYATERPSRLALDGPSHRLPPSAAQLIGLVVHELATNAAKYGALKGAEGALAVRWSVDGAGALSFVWTETSPLREPLSPPTRKGFGFRLLDQTVSRQLGGAWSADWTATGLVFAMTLPLQPAEPEDAAAPPRTQSTRPAAGADGRAPRASRPRVLMAEDEPLIALELESCLETLGFEVSGRCATLAEAEAMANSAPDLAILDVDLGGSTTFEVGKRLRLGGAQVMFCTGYAGIALPAELEGAPVLIKPVTHEALLAAIEALSLQDAA